MTLRKRAAMSGALGPHQADDTGPGPGRPRPAGGVHQRTDRSQHQCPDRRRTRSIRRLHRPGRHPGPAILPRPVPAHRPVGQRSRRRLVRPRRRSPRTRGRQRQAAEEDLLGAGGHHRHHGPAARRAARASGSRHRPGTGPARPRPRRHRRPGPGLRGRPRPQDRLARLRPRLYPGPARALPPPRPRARLPPRHGLPRRPARHPGKQPGTAAGRGQLEHPGFGGDSIFPRCSGLGGRCLPRYRRMAEPRSDHFSAFVLSNICPAPLSSCPGLVARAPPARPPAGAWASPRRAPVLRRGFPGLGKG